MPNTTKLGLPLFQNNAANQVLGNDGLALLNQLVQAAVTDRTNTPPGSPTDEALYLITATATGAWLGRESQLAYWLTSTGAWQYITPREGMLVHVNDEDLYYKYDGSAWVVFSAGGAGGWDAALTPAISSGTLTIDLTNPAWYRVTLNQNVSTINFTNYPAGKAPVFAIEFVQDGTGGRTVTWPGSVVPDDGGSIPPPATAAGASTVYSLSTTDGSTFKLATGVENGFTVQTGAINEAFAADLASAATVNIGAATGNTVNITGTTGITSFGTAPAGCRRTLVFQGALTITHNATSLILPFSGGNATTVAGDVADFVSLGSGNWRCTKYQHINGAVRGSNANGEYVRFPDGTQICLSSGLSVADISSALGSIFQSTSAITWTFPAAFATGVPPKVAGALAATTLWPGIGAPTATAVAVRGLAGVTTGTAQTVNLMAHGRWF